MKENIKESSPVFPAKNKSVCFLIESPLEQSSIVGSVLDWQGYYG